MVNRHQPFESWIFTSEELSGAESQALQEHLQECRSCLNLTQALQGMESHLRATPLLSPMPGFTARWETRLADTLLRQRRIQTFWVMMASIGGAVLLLLLTGWMILPLLRTPLPILLAWAYQSAGVFTYIRDLGQAFFTASGTIFNLIPITLWVAILVAMGSLGALWLVAYQRLTIPRRVF
ncbi:MAG: zf-HC2 domain-containing protein [Anaerolineales bacterium]|nr:MAG: zf-HC2 domain-containing protein [Anaerolineales bacterium]